MEITKALMKTRNAAGLTQKELSVKSGISQADTSRLENWTRKPSIALLRKLADAIGRTLKIEFVPKVNI